MHEFDELSYVIRNAPVDLTCQNRKIVWMNHRWYLKDFNEILEESVPEEDFHKAIKWLIDPFWIRENKHEYSSGDTYK
jgi:hypothetical protein